MLCEYVQQLSMFDYIAVTASMENRVCEYVDHLHEHFIEPVVIRNARDMPPVRPGYSIAIKRIPEGITRFPPGLLGLLVVAGFSRALARVPSVRSPRLLSPYGQVGRRAGLGEKLQ